MLSYSYFLYFWSRSLFKSFFYSIDLPKRYSSTISGSSFLEPWIEYIQSSFWRLDSGITPWSTYNRFKSSICFSSLNFLIRSYFFFSSSYCFYSAAQTISTLDCFSGCQFFLFKYDSPPILFITKNNLIISYYLL